MLACVHVFTPVTNEENYTSELKDMNAGQNVFQYNIQLNSKLNN